MLILERKNPKTNALAYSILSKGFNFWKIDNVG